MGFVEVKCMLYLVTSFLGQSIFFTGPEVVIFDMRVKMLEEFCRITSLY